MQEWTYFDNVHMKESFSYMIVEAGLHQLKDGSWIEAGVTKTGPKFTNVKFSKALPGTPVVIPQITT
jgi:hypothetical protein